MSEPSLLVVMGEEREDGSDSLNFPAWLLRVAEIAHDIVPALPHFTVHHFYQQINRYLATDQRFGK